MTSRNQKAGQHYQALVTESATLMTIADTSISTNAAATATAAAANCNNAGRCSAALTEAYRAGIALNNIAVHLQERRCDRQAYDTFRDAISLLRNDVLSTKAKESATIQITTSAENQRSTSRVDMIVRKAMLRLANAKTSSKSSLPPSPASSFVDVMSDDSDCASAMIRLLDSKCSTNRCGRMTLVRIEEYDTTSSSSLRNPNLDYAIVMHNAGVSSTIRGVRSHAERLFGASIKIAGEIANSSSNNDNENVGGDVEVLKKSSLVGMAATSALLRLLMTTSSLSGRDCLNKANKNKVLRCVQHSRSLKKVLDMLKSVEGDEPMTQAAAA